MAIPMSRAIEAPPPSRDVRSLLTEQLKVILEVRSVRYGVIGVMLAVASALALVPTPLGVDSGWMFIVPVMISAVAGGMKEGLIVALIASVGCAIYATAPAGHVDMAIVTSVLAARFALYGITAGFLGAFAEAHYAVQSNYRRLAQTDPLTNVSNVSMLYDELDVLCNGASPFAVMVLDLDDLKKMNDAYGHQVGSSAIQTVAKVLKCVVRQTDCVVRYGGDEFVVILRETTRPGAQIVGNRIREILSSEKLAGAPGTVLRASIGTAMFGEDGMTAEELLSAADRAMYADKRVRKAGAR